MPKFYFHLRGDGLSYDGSKGSEHASLADAELAAVRAAALIVERDGGEGTNPRWFEIADAAGDVQVIVPLRALLLLEEA